MPPGRPGGIVRAGQHAHLGTGPLGLPHRNALTSSHATSTNETVDLGRVEMTSTGTRVLPHRNAQPPLDARPAATPSAKENAAGGRDTSVSTGTLGLPHRNALTASHATSTNETVDLGRVEMTSTGTRVLPHRNAQPPLDARPAATPSAKENAAGGRDTSVSTGTLGLPHRNALTASHATSTNETVDLGRVEMANTGTRVLPHRNAQPPLDARPAATPSAKENAAGGRDTSASTGTLGLPHRNAPRPSQGALMHEQQLRSRVASMAARTRLMSRPVSTPRAVDLAFAAQLQIHLRDRLELHAKIAHARFNIALKEAGLQLLPEASHDDAKETAADLDETKIERISQLVLRKHLTPEATVRLLRGQCPKDPRPNKALFPDELARLLQGYSHCDTLIAVASAGFTIPTRAIALPKPAHPKNHNSAERHSRTVRRHLAEGQARNEYAFFTDAVLVQWTQSGHDIRLSPLGLVPKNNASLDVDGRVIHDLSAPEKAAVNDLTNKDLLPGVRWRRISEVASRIIQLHKRLTANTRIIGMAGDVQRAFRHLRVAASDARWLGAKVPGSSHWGLDLSGPFGWCGSPPFYVVFGRAISFLVSQESPSSLNPTLSNDTEPFWALEWMDDHILIELVTQSGPEAIPARATAAETALRLGMMAVLGPTSINESKFKAWTPNLHALGLIWHLNETTVSMPAAKIQRATERVDALLLRGRATKTALLQVLGSLRHVCSCAPAARAFYQRLHSVAVKATPFKTFKLPDLARRDLELFQAILAQADFAHVPAAIFDRSSEPGLHLYMDASDVGLVVLDLAHRRYIQLFFDQSEREMIRTVSEKASGTEGPDTALFSINVREHLSLCLAVSIWARAWSTLDKGTLHVHAWIDNSSSVSWANKLAASNVYAQELNRHLALAQAVNRLYVTAGHMAGARNEMADCGSRSLVEPFKSRWLQLSHGWEACPVPADLRFMYKPTSDVFKTPLWPRAHTTATMPHGTSGVSGASTTDSHHGSPRKNASRPTNSSSTFCTSATAATPLPPSDPNYAASLGVISDTAGTLWHWRPTTGSSSEGWNGTTEPPDEWSPSQRRCSGICVPDSTSTTPSSAHSGGLRSWASSFSCGSPSTSTKVPSPRSTVSA